MSNFNSLYPLAYNLGLGSGNDGFCHLMEIPLSDLVPVDVQAGRVKGNDTLNMFIYGTHVGFSVASQEGDSIANERTIHTIPELVSFLHSALASKDNVVIEEDPELDEQLEAIREAALKADLIESDEEDEEDDEFFQDDESADGEVELDADDEELEADDEVEEDDAEATIISFMKPKAKKGTKKYNIHIDAMLEILDEYYGEELKEAGVDTETMAEVLDEVFADVDEWNIDASSPLMPQLSDYVEFE